MAIDLAKLVVSLEAQTAKYQADLEKSQRTLRRFQKQTNESLGSINKSLGQVGLAWRSLVGVFSAGFVASGIRAMVSDSIELGDSLGKAAIKAGVSAEAISELSYAAKLSDVSLDDLSTALRKMQVTLSEAASGSKSANESLAALGLTTKDFAGLSADQSFELLAEQISKLGDANDRARAQTDLFGKSGNNLAPLFENGARGIRAAREEAQRLGLSFSQETLDNLGRADDSIKRLKASFDGLAATLVSKVAPGMSVFLESIAAFLHGDQIGLLRGQIETLERTQKDAFNLLNLPGLSNFRDYALERNRAQLAELEAAVPKGPALPTGDRAAPGYRSTAGDKDKKGASGADPLMVTVTSRRREVSALQQLYRQLDEDTQVQTDRAAAGYYRQQLAAEELFRAGGIGAEEYARRTEEALNDVLTGVEVTAKKVYETTESGLLDLSEFAAQAARNVQDIIADTLINGFDDGIEGVLQSFGQMLKEITAQIVAADLGRRLFGDAATGANGGGLGGLIGSVLGMFGGGSAAAAGIGDIPMYAGGGLARAGMPAIVGEDGPELFVPGRTGTVVPHNELRGMFRGGQGAAMQVTQQFTISAPGGMVSRQTQQQIAAAAQRGLAEANARNN